MKIEDFRKEKVDQDECPYWVSKRKISTPLGKFSTILEILDKDDTSPPDNEMLNLAKEAAEYVQSHIDSVFEIVLAASKLASEEDPHSFEVYEIPTDLTKATVSKYLVNLNIIVARDVSGTDYNYSSNISITPLWDEEHGLSLEFENGTIQSLNGDQFRIEDGRLSYE